MAHRTSSAALLTARTILESFELTVKPKERVVSGYNPQLTNKDVHVAVVVDIATNVYHLSLLRPHVHYWQRRLKYGTATAPQIGNFLNMIVEAFQAIPKFKTDEEPVFRESPLPHQIKFKTYRIKIPISKAALEVSRFLFHYYDVKPKRGISDDILDRMQVSHLAESSLGLYKAMEVLPITEFWKDKLTKGDATEAEIARAVKEIGVLLEYLPNYGDVEDEVKLLV